MVLLPFSVSIWTKYQPDRPSIFKSNLCVFVVLKDSTFCPMVLDTVMLTVEYAVPKSIVKAFGVGFG
jgi:hypothetical protein